MRISFLRQLRPIQVLFEETINARLTNVVWADAIAVALRVTSVSSTRLFRFSGVPQSTKLA